MDYLFYTLALFQETSWKRYNAMVYLSLELNTCINDLTDNRIKLRNIINSNQLIPFFSSSVILSDKNIVELSRIEIRQDIYSLFLGIKKLNHDLEFLSTYINNLNLFPQSSQIEQTDKIKLYNDIANQMHIYTENLIDETKDCLVKLRYFLEIDKPLLNTLHLAMLKQFNKNQYSSWLIEDRKKGADT